MKVAVIQYNAGNVVSVQNALQRLGIDPIVTADADDIRHAERVIFPGVGEANSAMRSLRASGLDALIPTLKQPFLGICLGLQLLCRRSEESQTNCLGVFDTEASRIPAGTVSPHMGWNTLQGMSDDLFDGITPEDYLYFVHSYRVPLCDHTTARTVHGGAFSSALRRDNFWGVQFHPEKSGHPGARILQNFLEMT